MVPQAARTWTGWVGEAARPSEDGRAGLKVSSDVAGRGLGSQVAVWTPERVELLFWGSSVLGLFGVVMPGRSRHRSGVWRGVQVAVLV